MNKTLHKTFNKDAAKPSITSIHPSQSDELLILHMRAFLKQASEDVIHPRPQLIKELLKKARTN